MFLLGAAAAAASTTARFMERSDGRCLLCSICYVAPSLRFRLARVFISSHSLSLSLSLPLFSSLARGSYLRSLPPHRRSMPHGAVFLFLLAPWFSCSLTASSPPFINARMVFPVEIRAARYIKINLDIALSCQKIQDNIEIRAARYIKINLDIALSCPNIQDNIDIQYLYAVFDAISRL